MAGLRDSKVRESGTTTLVMHKAVISAGNMSREELDWAICEIWPEMMEPKSMSIFITNPVHIKIGRMRGGGEVGV